MRGKAQVLILCVYAGLTWRFFRIISRGAINVFYYDQWDFNDATLFEKHSLWEIFRWQYGPQRHGLGGVAMKLLEPSIQWDSRYEAFGIGAILVLVAVLALYLKIRLFGPVDYTDVIIPALFLTPAQFEVVIGATNPGWSAIPIALIMFYCLSWTIRSNPWKYVCVLLVNFFLIYTGYGIFVGILTPGLIAIDYWKTRQPLSIVGFFIAILSLISFFVGYRSIPGIGCFSVVPSNPILYVVFMIYMLATAAGLKGSVWLALIVGMTILVAALFCLETTLKRLRNDEPGARKRDSIITLLVAFLLIFLLSTAYGRSCLGIGFALMPRYVTYTILGFYGLYLFSLSIARKGHRTVCIAALFFLVLLSSARMNSYDTQLANSITDGKRAWRDCYLRQHNVGQCDAISGFQVYPVEGREQLQQKLDFLERNHLNLFDGKH